MAVSLSLPRISIRRKALLGFGLVLSLLVIIPIITWRGAQSFLEVAGKVSLSRELLEGSQHLQRCLMEMESARRGFLLTGEVPYLSRFENLQPEVRAVFSTLQNGTLEDPAQHHRIEILIGLITENFTVQKAELLTRSQSPSQPGGPILSAEANLAREQHLRELVEEFEDQERKTLTARQRASREIGTRSTVIIMAGTSLALLALVLGGQMVLRDIAARRRSEEVLADQHNLLSSIIDTMPDNVFVKDVKGRYIMDNRAHRQFLELAEGETIEGKTVFDFFPNSLAVLYDAKDQEVIETGRAVRNFEEPVVTRGGGEFWLSTTKVPLRDPSGRILGLVCVSADITERRNAEEKLKRFAAQLERSNAELQNFASVASHDLQEPLRKIQAFSDRLKVKCGPQLGEDGLDYLARMQNAAERMRTLIQDLLKLTRVTSRAQPFERCDLNAIVREVLSDLEVAIEQRSAQVDIGPLPVIQADPVQIRQLFQNLISNGLKFQAPGEAARIKIAGQLLEGIAGEKVCQISVNDNGIGFDEKFTEQIFVVFQRLHSRSEYEGTGIGLAVCRKITDRHGGTIVAKSSPGQGATFIVTLPVHQLSNQTHE